MRRLKVWDAPDGSCRVWSAHEPSVFDGCRWLGLVPVVPFTCVVMLPDVDGCGLMVVYPEGRVHYQEPVPEREADWPDDGQSFDSLARYDCVARPFADYYCAD